MFEWIHHFRNLYRGVISEKSCALPFVNSSTRVYCSLAKIHISWKVPLCSKLRFYPSWRGILPSPSILSSTLSLPSDPTDELLMIIGIFSHFFALETTLAERQFFRALARLIGKRAARLSACGIAAIVSKMGYLDEGCAVGADGSLYNVRYNNTSLLCFSNNANDRNIPNSQKEYTKVSSTSSGRREGNLSREPSSDN